MAESKEIKPRTNPTPVQERYRCQSPMTLLDLIMDKSCRNRTAAKQVIASGRVAVDDVSTTKATDVLPEGVLVTIHRGVPAKPFSHTKLELIWEDNDYVVLYKESGIPTVNTAHKSRQETALSIMSQHYKATDEQAKVFMVNRLDNNTAGFIVFAKSVESKELLTKEWHTRVKHQVFVACIEGSMPEKTLELTATSSDSEGGIKHKISADIKVDKSSKWGGLHVVQADVKRARIYSLRKLFGDNGLSIMGDIRSRSAFSSRGTIALEQTLLEIQMPSEKAPRRYEHPYPTHFFTLLKEDKGGDMEVTNNRNGKRQI